jgi:hypothetical protein
MTIPLTLPISLFNLTGQPVNPALLSLEHQSPLGVTSLAQSLFGVDFNSHLLSVTSITDQAPVVESSSMLIGTIYPAQTELEVDTSIELVHDGSQPSPTQYDNIAPIEGLPVHSVIDPTQESSMSHAPFGASSRAEPTRNDTVEAVRVSQKKRRRVHETDLTGRRKYRDCNVRPNLDILDAYLTEESRKCESLGHQPPHETFLTPAIQQAIRVLSAEKTEIPAKILIYTASPCSIAALQEVLRTYRTHDNYKPLSVATTISRMERFDLIVSLDRGITIFQLRRRYHILALYKDCGGGAGSTTQIVITSSSDFADRPKRRGNPANRSVAELTERMMQDVFPALACDTDEHNIKYRLMSNLRRLGHRLNILEQRFGRGILGLIIDRGSTDPAVGITDAMWVKKE